MLSGLARVSRDLVIDFLGVEFLIAIILRSLLRTSGVMSSKCSELIYCAGNGWSDVYSFNSV